MAITYKRLVEPEDLYELEKLEGKVWTGDSVIPFHMTVTLQKFGGLFIGAFDGDEMVGFLYSFPGYTDGESHLCSHMLGIQTEYRKQGIGVVLKWMQRDEALKQGYRKVTWTYDPLETVNASLNIGKLGGIVRRYIPNCYGELKDELNRGLPTDRLLVEWFIESDRVERYKQRQTAPIGAGGVSVLTYEIDSSGLPVPKESRLDAIEKTILLPVPSQFQEIKLAGLERAHAWRNATSELFTHYFERGYTVCAVERDPVEPIVRYVLSSAPLTTILG
ncbi:MAG: GNAT family N-acetyltransferase [Clostridia bacterium]